MLPGGNEMHLCTDRNRVLRKIWFDNLSAGVTMTGTEGAHSSTRSCALQHTY